MSLLSSTPETEDIDVVFENLVFSEDVIRKKGYVEGFHDGESQGKAAGEQIGLVHGFDIGTELGYYKGVAFLCLAQDNKETAKKVASDLVKLVNSIQVLEFSEESEVLATIRSKFKRLCFLLGVKCIGLSGDIKQDF